MFSILEIKQYSDGFDGERRLDIKQRLQVRDAESLDVKRVRAT